jgi:hypothetical protein
LDSAFEADFVFEVFVAADGDSAVEGLVVEEPPPQADRATESATAAVAIIDSQVFI